MLIYSAKMLASTTHSEEARYGVICIQSKGVIYKVYERPAIFGDLGFISQKNVSSDNRMN